MPDLPTGTVTFLLTDIESSTRLWEQAPDQMRAALSHHDSVAEEILQRHDGALIKERGEGDSLFAVFARATDALAAACALQKALRAELWPAGTPLRVRMALHTASSEPPVPGASPAVQALLDRALTRVRTPVTTDSAPRHKQRRDVALKWAGGRCDRDRNRDA